MYVALVPELIRYDLAAVPMIHDNTSRASTACHYSPSLVAEEQQLHGSKDTLTLKGEKALLELLLGMVCHHSILFHLVPTTTLSWSIYAPDFILLPGSPCRLWTSTSTAGSSRVRILISRAI